jgi:putative salt-induced outer membrane protein
MRIPTLATLIVAAGALLAPASVSSQNAVAVDSGPLRVTVDLGFVDAAGNSNVTSFNLGERVTWTRGRWAFTQNARALYGETDGSSTTESYELGGRAQYDVSPRIGAFALLQYQRDPFAGVAARWSGGPGVSWNVVRSGRDTLIVETALTAQNERNTANVTQTFAAQRSAVAFKHLFGLTTAFAQTLEWVANLETTADQRLTSETAMTAPISRQIALRVSYLIRFDNQPEPGFEKTDRILTTGIQVAF